MESSDYDTVKWKLKALTEREYSLESPDDLQRWKQNIKVVETLRRWEYCDPSIPVYDLPVLEKPVEPDITTVKPLANPILDLETHHFDELAILVSNYKQGKTIFDTKMKLIDEIAMGVWFHVDTRYEDCLLDLSVNMRHDGLTVWKQLRTLSDIMEPVTQKTLHRLREAWDSGHETYLKRKNVSVRPEFDREQFYFFYQSFFEKCKAIGLVNLQFSADKILFKLGYYYESPLTCRRVEMKHFVSTSFPVSETISNDLSHGEILQVSYIRQWQQGPREQWRTCER